MPEDPSAALEFARYLNDQARAVVEGDGNHAAMFFLELPDGRLEVEQFDEDTQRPVGGARSKQLCEAVERTGARLAAFISEAWSAPMDEVPDGGAAGDAADPEDVLIVAAADGRGGYVVIETPFSIAADDSVEVGASVEHDRDGYQVRLLDDLHELWARMA